VIVMPGTMFSRIPGRAAGQLGLRNDPLTAFNFAVEIDGLFVAGFSEVSGLQIEIEVFPYREGGRNDYELRLPGPAKYPQNLVLKRGLTLSDDLWAWCREVAEGAITRRSGSVHLLGPDALPRLSWEFKEAYPVRWSGPDLRAGSSTVAIEALELVHKGLKLVRLMSQGYV
jgi:phage tail-like protein